MKVRLLWTWSSNTCQSHLISVNIILHKIHKEHASISHTESGNFSPFLHSFYLAVLLKLTTHTHTQTLFPSLDYMGASSVCTYCELSLNNHLCIQNKD